MLWVWPIDEIVCLSVFILSYREKRKPWKELFQNAKRNYFLMVGLPVIFFLSILVLSFVFSQKACIFYMWKKAFKRQPWIVLVNTDPKQKVFRGTDLTQTAGNWTRDDRSDGTICSLANDKSPNNQTKSELGHLQRKGDTKS